MSCKGRLVVLAGSVLLVMGNPLHGHELFLKFRTYFLPPLANVSVSLLNGTFEKSENAIFRDRMLDVSIVGPVDEVVHPESAQWRDENDAALLDFETGGPGTYVIGVSTAPRMIELSGADFTEYLEHDGLLDMLAERKRKGISEQDTRERYSKHVKAIVQVGDDRTGSFDHRLDYPIEIIPLENPYVLKPGDTMGVVVLKEGKPMGKQLLYASYESFSSEDSDDRHPEAVQTRTDKNGQARFTIEKPGRWYVRLIHMASSMELDVDYESNWATLTFEIR